MQAILKKRQDNGRVLAVHKNAYPFGDITNSVQNRKAQSFL
jgi:hypothetical protein